jgi:hypothetical protein
MIPTTSVYETRGERKTHSADDIIVVGKVRFALLAAEDFVGSEVHVVRKTHYDLSKPAFPLPPLKYTRGCPET